MNKENPLKEPLLQKENELKELNPTTNKKNSQNQHPDDEDQYQKISFYKLFFFTDVFQFRKHLSQVEDPKLNDIPPPYDFVRPIDRIKQFWSHWQHSSKPRDKSLIPNLIFKVFKKLCIISFLLALGSITTFLFFSWFLGELIAQITQKALDVTPTNFQHLLNIAFIIVALRTITLFCGTWYWLQGYFTTFTIRSTLIGIIYQKIHFLTLNAARKLDLGKTLNLMSNDLNDLVVDLMFFWQKFLSPYVIIVGSIMIWQFFGYITILSIVFLYGCLALTDYISNKLKHIVADKNILTDKRIKKTSELVENLKAFKMYAWEKNAQEIIKELRQNETAKFLKFQLLSSLSRTLSEMSPQICIILMAITYTYIGGVLSPEKVYTSLMILEIIKATGLRGYQIYSVFLQKFKSFSQRLFEILDAEEFQNLSLEQQSSNEVQIEIIQRNSTTQQIELKPLSKDSPRLRPHISVQVKNYYFIHNQQAILSDINMEIYNQGLVSIIGKIGSGKSCLILSLLKELSNLDSDKIKCCGEIAYIDQDCLIFPGTIKSNILFGLPYEAKRYQEALRKSDLMSDLDTFPNRDESITLEKGSNLSGGQRARICLARAYYSNKDIYILDDPLSALDVNVSSYIFQNMIVPLSREKIVIMVTHNLYQASQSERVILLDGGKIMYDGRFQDMRENKKALKVLKVLMAEENQKQLQRQGSESSQSSYSIDNFEQIFEERKWNGKAQQKGDQQNLNEDNGDEMEILEEKKEQQDNQDQNDQRDNQTLSSQQQQQGLHDKSSQQTSANSPQIEEDIITKSTNTKVNLSTLFDYLKHGLNKKQFILITRHGAALSTLAIDFSKISLASYVQHKVSTLQIFCRFCEMLPLKQDYQGLILQEQTYQNQTVQSF